MIGFVHKPSGRMGNVMIQYVFLRQLSEKIGIDYFHIDLPYKEKVENFKKHNMSLGMLFHKKWRVDMAYIERVGMSHFIEEAKNKDIEEYDIILQPPVLGHLFDYKEENPAKYIHISNQYKQDIENSTNCRWVGIHFRGTDFKGWNEKASLSYEYYREAIELLMNREQNLKFILFTDDNEFDAYKNVMKYLNKQKYNYIPGDANREMMVDFYQMSQCDYIISSPSTFAIMATLYGKENKQIIHNRQWVQYCVEQGEQFWIEIAENRVPYYNVVAII